MKSILLVLVLTFLLNLTSHAQQKTNNVAVERYVSVNNVLPVIVSQPTCPIKIENAVAVKDNNGQIRILYQIKNVGKKEIKEYSIARWYSDNTGYIGTGIMSERVEVLKPNQRASTIPNYLLSKSEVLTENQSAKSDETRNELQIIGFVMITDIWFSDGSKYSEMNRFNTLEKHLQLFEIEYDKLGQSRK